MLMFLPFLLGLGLSPLFIYFPCTVLIIFILISLFFITHKKLLSVWILLLCLTGMFYGIFKSSSSNHPIKTGYIINKQDNIYLFKELEGGNIKVYTNENLDTGKIYQIRCKNYMEHKNPYQYSYVPFCYAQEVVSIDDRKAGLIETVREKINNKIFSTLEQETAGVLAAMTTGHRASISKNILEDFQKTGLIHLLSISGAHFSLLFTASFLCFKTLIKRLPYRAFLRLTLYIKPSQLGILLSFPVVTGYFLIVEPNYPATRAFIMATLFMIGVLSERKSIWIITLSMACLIILIINPQSIKDLSFQLSFLATAAIGFVSDIYKSFKEKIESKILKYVILSILVSISATLITAPLIIYRFHYISLITPLTNITAGLFIGMVLFPLNMLFIFIYLVSGIYPSPGLINFLGNAAFKMTHIMASFKFSSIYIPPIPLGLVAVYYFLVLLFLLSFYTLKRVTKKTVLCLLIFLILLFSLIFAVFTKQDRENLKITFLDVGQAESAVIETPKTVFVVDTGKTGWQTEQFLKAKGVKEIQALIITHEQKDHAGGFERIIEKFKLKEIWDNGYIRYNIEIPSHTKIRHLERGDILKTPDGCTFTVLHPYKGFYSPSLSKDSNDLSLVFKLECFKRSYLFTSDAGIHALESLPLKFIKSDILKIPHHGSKNSYVEGFYTATSPDICIISAGKYNPYHHPHNEVIEKLRKICKIYRTDIDGAIQIYERVDGAVEIKTFNDTVLNPAILGGYEFTTELKNLKKLFILW